MHFFASCLEPIIPANAPIPSSRHGLLSPSQIGMCPNTLNHRDGALSKVAMEPTVTAVSSASPRRSMVGLTIYDFSQRHKRLVIDKHRHCASKWDTRVNSVYPGENQPDVVADFTPDRQTERRGNIEKKKNRKEVQQRFSWWKRTNNQTEKEKENRAMVFVQPLPSKRKWYNVASRKVVKP